MLHLISLEVENVCQHSCRSFDFEYGITGVVGRNGCGKSNFIDTILYFAITGKTPEDVRKEDLIKWGATTASTRLVFSLDGRTLELTRKLHTSFIGLDDADDKQFKLRGAEANRFMENAIGTDAKVLREACWTAQGELTAVLNTSHAKRVTFFQKLVDVHRAEKLRAIISEFGTQRLPAVIDNAEALRQLRLRIDELVTALDADAGTRDIAVAEYARLRPLAIEAHKKMTREDARTVNDRIALKEADLAKAVKLRDEVDAKIKALAIDGKTAVPLCPEELEFLGITQERIDADLVVLEKTGSDLTAAILSRDSLVAPQNCDASNAWLTESKAWVRNMRAEYEFLKQGNCPTCRRPLDISAADLEKRLEEIKKVEADIPVVQKAVAEMQQQQRVYVAEQQKLSTRITKLEKDLQVQAEALEHRSAVFSKYTRDAVLEKKRVYENFSALSAERNRLVSTLGQHNGVVDRLNAEIKQLRSIVVITDEERKIAADIVAEADAAESLARQWTEHVAVKTSELNMLQQNRDALEAQQVVYEKVKKIRAVLERSYEVLHRDQLPRLVMTTILVALNHQLTSYLEEFDTTFTARVSDDFDILVSFPEKSDIPAGSILSGGQQVALSLAFKFAVATLFSSSMPLVVLDEPTVYLDTNNIKRMAALLEKVRDNAAKGTYILVATHDEILTPSFSRTVDISA